MAMEIGWISFVNGGTSVLEALLRDEHRFLPLSGLLHGFHGLDDGCLSLPRIVTRKGIEAPLPIPMTVDDELGLHDSADRIRAVVRGLGN